MDNKTDNEKLFLIQKEYLRIKDEKVLGKMLEYDLLPVMATKYIKRYLGISKKHMSKDDIYDIAIDCSLRVIEHIKQGIKVNISFYEKMRQTVFNYFRDRQRQYFNDKEIFEYYKDIEIEKIEDFNQ